MAKIEDIADEPITSSTSSGHSRHSTRNRKEPLIERVSPSKPEISELDQLKIIDQTGIMNKLKNERVEEEPLLFQAFFFTILLLGIYTVLYIAVLFQFHETLTLSFEDEKLMALLKRLATLFPAFYLIVYFTNKYCNNSYVQALFLFVGTAAGIKNMEYIHRNGVFGEMLLTPGIGTIWAYVLMQMNLSLACISLVLVFGYHYGSQWYLESDFKLY